MRGVPIALVVVVRSTALRVSSIVLYVNITLPRSGIVKRFVVEESGVSLT